MGPTFKEIDHSGDIGIEATGADLETIFENTALGLFGLMVRGDVGASEKRTLRVDSNSYEDLLVDWLSELISRAALEGELYSSVSINEIGEYYLEAVVRGEKMDVEKHDLRFEVKALGKLCGPDEEKKRNKSGCLKRVQSLVDDIHRVPRGKKKEE